MTARSGCFVVDKMSQFGLTTLFFENNFDCRYELLFYVNGKRISLQNVEPDLTLTTFLRRQLFLTGTKSGCNDGSCGACTVMVSDYDRLTDTIRHRAVASCLLPLCTLHGRAVTTVEGIGSLKSGLHPVQERISRFHGTQCGFCTPGMVMSMYTLLRNNPHPSGQDINDSLHGNLCRCTGYRSILDGFRTFSNESCCCGRGSGCCEDDTAQENPICQHGGSSLTDVSSLTQYDPTQDLIFPPQLQLWPEPQKCLRFEGRDITWYRPVSLSEAVRLKSSHLDALIAAGCTNMTLRLSSGLERQKVIDVSAVRELRCERVTVDGVEIGAGLTIAQLLHLVTRVRNNGQGPKSPVLEAVPQTLQSWGVQLRNCATVGGHLMLRKPKYDLVPLLVAAGCSVNVSSTDGQRRIMLDERFFLEPSPIGPADILTALWIPTTGQNQHVKTYKVAKRKHQDFASLSAAFVFSLTENRKMAHVNLVFGGDIPALVVSAQAKTCLEGRFLTEETMEEVMKVLQTELSALGLSDVEQFWAQGFLSKFLLQLVSTAGQNHQVEQSQSESYMYTPYKTKQIFEIDNEGSKSEVKVVGQPIPHSTSLQQTTGEATYVDDMAPVMGELFIVPVLSRRPYAKLVSVDVSEALACPGIHGYIDHTDIPGVNTIQSRHGNEEIYASETVNCVGQMICGIVSTDREAARKAVTLVKVHYDDLSPVILTIKDAIEASSFIGTLRTVSKGETTIGFQQSDHVTEGEVYIGGQKHMYLETQTCLVIPQEDHQFEVFSSCQTLTELQASMAYALSVPAHKIMARSKRMGGAFGGKESRTFLAALPAAIAALKYGRPVRAVLDRTDDTLMTGGRHPLLAKYKVGYRNDGHILSLEMKLYLNAGHVIDTSQSVLDHLMLQGDTAYNIPHVRLEGRCCRTNLPSNCAFRGFGGPQLIFAVEDVITTVATQLAMLPEKVRYLHLYSEGEITLAGVQLKQCTLERCWQECLTLSEFEKRRQLSETFNSTNRFKKRGIAVQPILFGVGIYEAFLNQAGALVNIYTDGSVLVSHGGTEMGQGLHTKIRQIACDTLGVPVSKVHISETCTSMVPNATATAASLSTDINGLAIQSACQTLRERLRPFSESNPKGLWEDWVSAAYMDRVSLSATGYCKYGTFGYDFQTSTGQAFMYYSYGVGCTELEIDCLTGEHQLIRTDLVMDVGRSINPAIDIGQIEGGFVQGYGYYMMEEERYSEDGRLLTDSPLTYKIPLAADIPKQFNVALLKNSRNVKGVFSSKGVGEPPLLLSLSAYLAAHDAVCAARTERGLDKQFILDSPATPAAIVKACTDGLSGKTWD